MFNKKTILIIAGIIVIFGVGLVGYFIFSEPYGDGLEKTMEEGGVEESEPKYSAPLNYGDNYLLAFLMGCFGFSATLLSVYLLCRIMRKKDAS